MLDLHAHFLPGIDDGPRTTEDALLLLRALQDEGVQHVVATPHIYPGVYDNTPERIAQVFTAFRQQAEAAGLTLGMSWGAEVRLCPEVLDWLDAGTLVALGDGDQGRRTVLLEMPDGQVPVGADRLVARLVARGWQPLIAHPERNRQVMEHPTALEPLLAAGAVFQLTAASLLGDFGQRAQAAAQRLLAVDGAVMAVASDTHNLKGRRPQMKAARAWLVEQFGEARAHDLTERQPARLVGVGQVVFEGRDGTVLRDLTGAVSPGVARSAGIDLLDFPAAGAGRAPAPAPAARAQDWDLGFAWSAPPPPAPSAPAGRRSAAPAPVSRAPVIEPLMPSSPPPPPAPPAPVQAEVASVADADWPPPMDFEPTAPDVMADLRWVAPAAAVVSPTPTPTPVRVALPPAAPMQAPMATRDLPLETLARVVPPAPRAMAAPLNLRAGTAALADVPVLSDVSALPVTPVAPVGEAAPARPPWSARMPSGAGVTDVEPMRRPVAAPLPTSASASASVPLPAPVSPPAATVASAAAPRVARDMPPVAPAPRAVPTPAPSAVLGTPVRPVPPAAAPVQSRSPMPAPASPGAVPAAEEVGAAAIAAARKPVAADLPERDVVGLPKAERPAPVSRPAPTGRVEAGRVQGFRLSDFSDRTGRGPLG